MIFNNFTIIVDILFLLFIVLVLLWCLLKQHHLRWLKSPEGLFYKHFYTSDFDSIFTDYGGCNARGHRFYDQTNVHFNTFFTLNDFKKMCRNPRPECVIYYLHFNFSKSFFDTLPEKIPCLYNDTHTLYIDKKSIFDSENDKYPYHRYKRIKIFDFLNKYNLTLKDFS